MARFLFFTGSFMLMALLVSPVVIASDQGEGIVSMKGAIVDTACAIDTESADQSVVMPTIPLSDIIRDGQSAPRPFSVKLYGCHTLKNGSKTQDWHQFTVTFDGIHDGRLFAVRGAAEGVGLEITDSRGNIAVPGIALPSQPIIPGNSVLSYTLRLEGDHHTLSVGSYHADIRFKLDYY